MGKNIFKIINLHVSISSNNSEQKILNGINLTIQSGEVHAIMGPNGAGKSTLALSLMGHPNYKIKNQKSKIKMNGKNITDLNPEEKAREGLFVSFQQPIEITGVSMLAFLRTAYKALHPEDKIPLSKFKNEIRKAFEDVGLDESFMRRSLNEGFSGGEKKRAETAQLLMLKPKFAILDEIDSGLDVDSLRIIAKTIREAVRRTRMGIILITHYQRILHYVKPDYVHILIDGIIKKSDGINLVSKIESEGYGAI